MSNSAYISRVRVQTLDKKGEVLTSVLGFKVGDNEETATVEWFESDKAFFDSSNREIVDYVSSMNSDARDVIEFSQMNYDGIEIDDEFVLWADIMENPKP